MCAWIKTYSEMKTRIQITKKKKTNARRKLQLQNWLGIRSFWMLSNKITTTQFAGRTLFTSKLFPGIQLNGASISLTNSRADVSILNKQNFYQRICASKMMRKSGLISCLTNAEIETKKGCMFLLTHMTIHSYWQPFSQEKTCEPTLSYINWIELVRQYQQN